jgi:outer membrane receptor protein involved in Fe transport
MSAGQEKSGRFELQASGPRAALRGGVSLRDFGDLHAGGELGVRSPSGYGEKAADVKAALRLSDRNLLTAAYHHVRQSDVPRWDQVAQRGFSLYSFDPQVRQLGYAQLQSTLPAGWLESLSATASFHRSDETRVRQTRGSSLTIREHDVVDTAGLSVQVRSRPAGGWTLAGGAEAYRDVVESGRTDFDEATGLAASRRGLYADGARALSTAAYVSGRWENGRLDLDLGARFNHHRLRAADASFGTIDVSPSALVGSVAASLRVGAGQRLFGSVVQGFRAPNIDDLSTLGLFDFGVEVPSPDLRPERAWSYELGWKARTRKLATVVSAYRMELRDLIDRVPDTFEGSPFREGQRVYRRANVGRAYVEGIEAELEWNAAADLTAFGNVAYTYGQLVTAGQPLRRIPPVNGLAGLRWTGIARLGLDARVRFAGRQDRLAPGDRADHRIDPSGTAGWAVLGARAVYTLRADLRLVGALENVFDEAYRVHGSGIDGYGRHAWLSAQLTF